MNEKTFPYAGWVLLPSFKPVEKTFAKSCAYCGGEAWHDTVEGKSYSTRNIFPSKQAAIEWARADLQRQQAEIDKKQANLNKRAASLDKAGNEPR